MKPITLSTRASRSLQQISDWTLETFGDRQMVRYNKLLSQRMQALAAGLVHSRSCSVQFGSDISADLRLTKAGTHFIIFTETPADILILDFIHQYADIGGRLGGPEE